jgi:hypothetical protein
VKSRVELRTGAVALASRWLLGCFPHCPPQSGFIPRTGIRLIISIRSTEKLPRHSLDREAVGRQCGDPHPGKSATFASGGRSHLAINSALSR